MITIRGYEPDDLLACRDLWVELTLHHRRIYDVDTIGGDDPGSQFDEHLAAVGPDRLWVAERDGEFATVECELLAQTTLRTRQQARNEIFSWIEGWYNPHRRHSALSYQSPTEHEKRNWPT